MTYQVAATAVTLNDLEGHLPVEDLLKYNPSNICVAFCRISTDSVLARFLCISRASCAYRSQNISCVSLGMINSPPMGVIRVT